MSKKTGTKTDKQKKEKATSTPISEQPIAIQQSNTSCGKSTEAPQQQLSTVVQEIIATSTPAVGVISATTATRISSQSPDAVI